MNSLYFCKKCNNYFASKAVFDIRCKKCNFYHKNKKLFLRFVNDYETYDETVQRAEIFNSRYVFKDNNAYKPQAAEKDL